MGHVNSTCNINGTWSPNPGELICPSPGVSTSSEGSNGISTGSEGSNGISTGSEGSDGDSTTTRITTAAVMSELPVRIGTLFKIRPYGI